MGLAPRDSEEGGEVHVNPGCPAPFILRRLDNPNPSDTPFELGDRATDGIPQYMIVGNGLFHGFMGGGAPKWSDVKDEGGGMGRMGRVQTMTS